MYIGHLRDSSLKLRFNYPALSIIGQTAESCLHRWAFSSSTPTSSSGRCTVQLRAAAWRPRYRDSRADGTAGSAKSSLAATPVLPQNHSGARSTGTQDKEGKAHPMAGPRHRNVPDEAPVPYITHGAVHHAVHVNLLHPSLHAQPTRSGVACIPAAVRRVWRGRSAVNQIWSRLHTRCCETRLARPMACQPLPPL
jgi:hypothetical protein